MYNNGLNQYVWERRVAHTGQFRKSIIGQLDSTICSVLVLFSSLFLEAIFDANKVISFKSGNDTH